MVRKQKTPIFGSPIWEELNNFRSKATLIETEHVKAHRTEKERQQMSLFEKCITEGNEKADEPAKEGAIDEWRMSGAGKSKEREEVSAALQYAASFHCLVEEWKDCEELKPSQKRSGLP